MRVWFDALGPAEHFFICGSSLGFLNWKWEHFGQLQHFDTFLSQGSYLTSNEALCVPCNVAWWGYHWANEWFWAFFCCIPEVKVPHLKLPSSFGWVLLQSLVYLQSDLHTTWQQKRAAFVVVGNSLNLFSVSPTFSDRHGTWKLLETDSPRFWTTR